MAERTTRGEIWLWLEEVAHSQWPVCIRWPYPSVHAKGYGKVRRNGIQRLASVVVCEMAHGPRPAGLVCCHSCNNAACVNPRHLRWDTYKSNNDDRLGNGTYHLRRNGRREDGSIIH